MSCEIQNNYTYVFVYDCEESIMPEVKEIQKTLEWDEMDLRIARRRLLDQSCPKVVVRNADTAKLIAYAVLVPNQKIPTNWYLSQIAVTKDCQRSGIGKAIMAEIFKNAIASNIKEVCLDTESNNEKLMSFYEKSSSSSEMTILDRGQDRFGNPKVMITYKLA